MNILPKKRWHVRTKDNIARVRRDEALAAEEEKKKQLRIETAEREARTEALRKKARQQYGSHTDSRTSLKVGETSPDDSGLGPSSNKHVNLFYELERNELASDRTNEEYEKEKKLEKEKYEKQIGYLTYLGQDTNELTGAVSWYNKARDSGRDNGVEAEVGKKQKTFEDPLVGIRKYLGCEGVQKIAKEIKTEDEGSHRERKRSGKHKKEKKKKRRKKEKKKKKKKSKKRKRKRSSSDESSSTSSSSSSSSSEEDGEDGKGDEELQKRLNLEKLRAERLRREAEERRRTEEVIARRSGIKIEKAESPPARPAQKYNSQFNPHLAKQNFN